MLFPESWLRAWANPDLDAVALAEQLTMAGLEVEETHPYAPPFTGVVVARIVAVAPHPNADRLRVCQVDDGSAQPLQIVCGAPNAAEGLLVPLARVGAELPQGMRIAAVTMRGERSEGMLCSARELGLADETAGLLILPPECVPGEDVRRALDLDDQLLTIKLTPNRADCLSIAGVAREIAALTGCALKRLPQPEVAVTLADQIPVRVHATDLCGRFAGRVVRGVNARAETPAWMKSRLERAGQRPISALVDISNYVLLELGRPTHVFDLQHVREGLEVRWGQPGEQLTLLNGQTVTVDEQVGVIASGGVPQSLAGIMGGAASAVTLDTRDVFLEAAFWWPEAIMGRPRRFKLTTEAGHRYERGVDYATIPEHLDIMTALILDICGGQAGPVDDQVLRLPERAPVRMRLARCTRVLGISLQADEVADIFTRLGFSFRQEADSFVVTPPAARFDLSIEEDLIEEVARIHGFDRIPDNPPLAPAVMRAPSESRRDLHALRDALAAMDYQEVINYSFVEEAWERDYCENPEPIRLLNPIASQLAVMRSSLLGGLLDNIAYNMRRRQSRVRLFEIGRVFARDPAIRDGDLAVAGVAQPIHLAAAAWGPALPEQWGTTPRAVDFFDVKADLENLLGAGANRLQCTAAPHPMLHPGRSARLLIDDQPVGWLGEVHPQWVQALDLDGAPVVFEVDAAAIERRVFPRPEVLSRQPVVIRDLAIWVDTRLPWQAVLATLKGEVAASESLSVIRDIRLFDVWRGADDSERRSLALRFWFQGRDETLDDARIEQCMAQLLEILSQRHGARLRS